MCEKFSREQLGLLRERARGVMRSLTLPLSLSLVRFSQSDGVFGTNSVRFGSAIGLSRTN